MPIDQKVRDHAAWLLRHRARCMVDGVPLEQFVRDSRYVNDDARALAAELCQLIFETDGVVLERRSVLVAGLLLAGDIAEAGECLPWN